MGLNFAKPSVTADDLKTYKRDGVVQLKGVLSGTEIESLRRGVELQMRNAATSASAYDFEELQRQAFSEEDLDIDVGRSDRFDIELLKLIVDTDPEARPIRDDINGKAGEGHARFFYDAAGWRHYEEIRSVALDSALPSVVTELMDTTYTHFWEDNTFVKAPLTPQRTVFHQDWSYFQIEGEKACIVWIPLDPVDAENGRMEYVRGSHLWGRIYAPSIFFAQSANPVSPYDKLPDIEGNQENYDIIGFDCQPGDVIVHHVKTVHGSGGNISKDRGRAAMSFRYCGDDIRYFDKPGAIEQQYLQGQLENGDRLHGPDYPLVLDKRKSNLNLFHTT